MTSEQGRIGSNVLYELDSDFNAVLGSGRGTHLKHMVISPEEMTVLVGRVITSWYELACPGLSGTRSWSQGFRSLSLPEPQFAGL